MQQSLHFIGSRQFAWLTIGISLLAFPANCGELFVDASAADGGNGSEDAPFNTIQDAVDAAVSYDIIRVKPGVYDRGGGTVSGTGWSQGVRVKFPAASTASHLSIISTGGREVTHIVGDLGAGTEEMDGSGGAVACVYVPNQQCFAKVEGFTLRNGCNCRNWGYGGGFTVHGNQWTTNYATLAYSTISNCVGDVNAMYGGVIVSTLIADNTATKYGSVYMATLFNCIITGSSGASSPIINCGRVINTTVANNPVGRSAAMINKNNARVEAQGLGHFYNCAFFGNGSTLSDQYGTYHRCFLDGSTYSNASHNVTLQNSGLPYTNLCMSVIMGDFRPIAGGRLDAQGDNSYLNWDEIPAEYRHRDFYGKPLEPGYTVPLGAILPAATPASAGLWMNHIFRLNGRKAARSNLAHYTEVWPAAAFIQRTSTDSNVVAISVNKYAGESTCYNYFVGFDIGAWIGMPPYNVENKSGYTTAPVPVYYQSSSTNLYVDCNLADYTGHDGSTWAKAFKTIQEAVDVSVTKEKAAYIRVKGGVYDEGGATDATLGAKARVVIPSTGDKCRIIEAVDGPENTFIVGAPDSDTLSAANYPGIGPNAYRCVICRANYTGFSGFTFTNGYAHSTSSSQHAGGFYAANTYCQVNDSVFTDCHATDSAATLKGTFHRTLFENNAAVVGVSRGGNSYGCIYRNNYHPGCTYDCAINDHYLYNCTVYEPESPSSCKTFYYATRHYNCVGVAGGAAQEPNAGYFRGNVIHPHAFKSIGKFQAYEALLANPCIASPGTGDFRPLDNSPVIGAGTAELRGTPANNATRLCGDFHNQCVITADGRITAGAVVETRKAVTHYVSPAGDDAADGLTEATAKRTLQAAMEDPTLCEGEEVVALPGVYAEGSQGYTGIVETNHPEFPEITTRARVTVPMGVTLRSRDGAEATVIEGAAATHDADEYGRGPDAMRCAMVEAGAVLRGFTLRGGRSAANDSEYRDDAYAGGVLGRHYKSALVEDCILTNNIAANGGGGNFCTFNRCRFLGNKAKRFASAVRHGKLYNCFFDGNQGPRTTEVLYDVVNCTYGDNYNLSGTSATEVFQNMGGCEHLVNTVVYGVVGGGNWMPGTSQDVRNCVFPKEMAASAAHPFTNTYVNVDRSHTTAELRALFVHGVPMTMTNLIVDAGADIELAGEFDAAQGARVRNGTIDIGAFEYDWLGDYGRALGRRIEVTEVTDGVVETDGVVTLADGAELTAVWRANAKPGSDRARMTEHTVNVAFAGPGVFEAWVNGVKVVPSLTAGGSFSFRSDGTANDIVFKYMGEGTAAITECSRVIGSVIYLK